MKASLCNQTGERKCFTNFLSGKVDPYRWPCEDESRCILRTSLCDAKLDCPDGSDEKQGCPWYVRLNFWFTILICLAAVLQSLLLHSLFAAWSRSLSQPSNSASNQVALTTESPSPAPPLPPSNPEPSTSDKSDEVLPSVVSSPVQSELTLIPTPSESNAEQPVTPDTEHALVSADSESTRNSESTPNPHPDTPVVDSTESEIVLDVTSPLEQTLASSVVPAPPSQPTPSFLLHPALSHLEGQQWSWQDVGKELKIEIVFFNRDRKLLLSFLSKIEAQDAHPDTVHRVFKGFFSHLEAEGHTRDAVAFALKQAIGHHKLAHMALKGPPNALDRKAYELTKWLEQLEGKNKVGFACVALGKTVQSSIPPFLIYLDLVKDLVLYKILHGTIARLEEGCVDSSKDTCLVATAAEENLLTAMLASFTVSIVSTSLHAFHNRHHFFHTNPLFDTILFIASPLLPAVYHFEIASISQTLEKEKKGLTNLEYQSRKEHIARLKDSVQQSKSIEVGLEAITQILILCGLATFFYFVFKAPSGQTYSYFFGVALLVLKGNSDLFVASVIISLFGPSLFFVNNENHKKKESFNATRKIVLFLRNTFLLLARLGAIVSAIFFPVISQWKMFVGNAGVDAADRLDNPLFEVEFNVHVIPP